jgi:BirA family transcriptional regulator, biotin operon repressor / biotin---[acetyl-CoA-carboxylase] ligase
VTDSTNDRARALAIAGAPHGTLVTAAEQAAGRGRQGRRWSAPAGSALLMSLVLRANQANQEQAIVTLLPLIAAVAVCDIAGEQAMVKWPNDIVVAHDGALRKLGGILIEARPQEGWAVLGIGLNVAVRLEELPTDVRAGAATMGQTPARIEPTLARLLDTLGLRLAEPERDLLEAYRARDALRGRDVAWTHGPQGRVGRGRVNGVDERGRLLVALDEGGLIALHSGEVHLRL